MAYLIAVFASLLGIVGDYFLKISGNGPKYVLWWPLLFGIFFYAVTAVVWFFAFKHMTLATVGMVYSLTTVAFLTLLGTFYFKEQLTVVEGIGLALTVVTLVLLARFS